MIAFKQKGRKELLVRDAESDSVQTECGEQRLLRLNMGVHYSIHYSVFGA